MGPVVKQIFEVNNKITKLICSQLKFDLVLMSFFLTLNARCPQNGQARGKNLAANAIRFLKYAWSNYRVNYSLSQHDNLLFAILITEVVIANL